MDALIEETALEEEIAARFENSFLICFQNSKDINKKGDFDG